MRIYYLLKDIERKENENRGEFKERKAIFNIWGELRTTKDSGDHRTGCDYDNVSIKSERATLTTTTTNIQEYLAEDKAERYLYVMNDEETAYMMNRQEFEKFLQMFSTKSITSRTHKPCLRLGRETEKMRLFFHYKGK